MLDLSAQGFNVPATDADRERYREELGNFRVIDEAGTIPAKLLLVPMAHFFGGAAVSAAGIASVTVAAEARGKGFARTLMHEALRELRASGVAISSLYPATVPTYRACGYAFGGVRTQWVASLRDLHAAPSPGVEPFGLETLAELNEAYEGFARQTNGLIRRSDVRWKRRVLLSDQTPIYRYLVREEGRITGWLVYRLGKSADPPRFRMSARDLFWTTPGAARALLSLAARHASTGATLEWHGPPIEPLNDFTNEGITLHEQERWMLRLVDAPAAFEARGYAPLVETGVTIAIRDSLFPENEGPWRVDVTGGRAKVVTSSDGAPATADVGTWSSIWTGFLRATDAVRAGVLIASTDQIASLEAVFAGATPWLADYY